MSDQTKNDERTIQPLMANLLGVVFGVALTLLTVGLFRLATGHLPVVEGPGLRGWVIVLAVVIAGIPVHELIHSATFRWLGRIDPKQIRFGFNLKAFAPFVHCAAPVPVSIYRASAVMPGIVLGVLPLVAAFVTGSGILFAIGYVLSLAAMGDVMLLLLMNDLAADQYVQDHATKPGFVVLNSQAARSSGVRGSSVDVAREIPPVVTSS